MPSQSRSMTSGDMVIDNRGVILDLGPKEKEFQKWWAYWSEKTGLSKDPNPDLHFYDNRKAFLAGIEPKIDPTDGSIIGTLDTNTEKKSKVSTILIAMWMARIPRLLEIINRTLVQRVPL